MDLGKVFLPSVLSFFLIVSIASAQNVYTHTFYDSNTGANPETVYSPSLRTDKTNCSATITAYIDSTTATGSDYEIITQFYTPHGYEAGYGSRPISGNVTCLGHGQVTTTTANESQWESKIIATRSGGTSHYPRIQTDYECGFTDDWIELSTSGYDLDSDGYSPNVYFRYQCVAGATAYQYFIDETDQDECSGVDNEYLIAGSHYFCCGVGCVDSANTKGWWIMPFTTGESGRIQYEYSAPFTFQADEEYGYYEMEDPAGTYVQLTSASGNLTLKPETNYGFYVHGVAPYNSVERSVNINISIEAYNPAWVCGDWSECESGLQYRTCVDPLSKIPDNIEYRGCLDEAFFELLLGFEEGVTPSPYVRKCELQWWPACTGGYSSITTTIEYPENWNILNPGLNYFLKMTGEHATQGSRSLQMWYIPPMWRYHYPGAYCNWSNSGLIPQVYKGTNESLFVAYNVTFPSTYMTIDYDVKQCQYPVEQYSGWCGRQCYGYNGNCSEEAVRGEYVSILTNPTTGEIIYEFYDEADLSWGTKHIDLTGSNITTGETYNLVFAVYPRHLTDAYGHCIYLDNVKIAIRTAELDCEENYCVDQDLYKTRELNQTCVYEIEYNSPECLSEENRILAEEYNDYCVDQSLFSWNNETNEWEETLNATYCIEQEEEAGITEPLNFLEQIGLAYFAPFLGDSWPFFALFLTPLFLAFVASLGVSAWIINNIKVNSGEGIIFAISFNGFLGVFSLIGWFPGWYTLLMIVLSGAIIAYQMFGKT